MNLLVLTIDFNKRFLINVVIILQNLNRNLVFWTRYNISEIWKSFHYNYPTRLSVATQATVIVARMKGKQERQ